MQKQPPTNHPHSTKQINAEAKGITVSTALSSTGQNKASASEGKAPNTDARSLASLISGQQPPLTDVISGPQSTQSQIPVEIHAKPAHVGQKNGNRYKSAKKIASILKPHINFSKVSQTSESKPKPTQIARKTPKQELRNLDKQIYNKRSPQTIFSHINYKAKRRLQSHLQMRM